MNDYERLLARVKALNVELASECQRAYRDKMTPGDTEEFYEANGEHNAYDTAKQLVEKILEDFPDKYEAKPGDLALTSDEIIQGIVKVRSLMLQRKDLVCDYECVGLQFGVDIIETLLEMCKVARP